MATPTPTSLDPDRVDDPVILYADHFPLPSLYRTCLEETKKVMQGSTLYAAINTYLIENLGVSSFYEFFKQQLGETLYHAILAEMAPVFTAQLKAVEENEAEEIVIPTISLFIVKALTYVMNRGLKLDIALTVKTVRSYCQNLQVNGDELHAIVTPLEALLKTMSSITFTMERHKEWRAALKTYVEDIAVPAQSLHDVIEEAETLMEERALLTDSKGTGFLEQIDGSEAPDVTDEYISLIEPVNARQETIERQITATLASHEAPYKASIALWWKLHASHHPEPRHTEAWALDAVGRVLKKLFTPKQIRAMENLLPMDEVVGALVCFVMGEDINAKNITWPQLRATCLFTPIIRVSMDSESVEKRADEIYQALELPAEFSLMKAAFNIHSDHVDAMIFPWKHRTII